ncbi:DUF6279 family lipoprotein [Ferrimonas senticii]|uniref:DUF6279 family lipoprotein n=1 Tax=Ferrimonas senticii TaxID=394566 RepID=UPI000403F332|nr:DUF6279 family lipoprotein [Ferrimonas senticii]
MRKWIVAIGLLLLSGCSVKWTYNWLDWLIPWQLDDYVELNDRQSEQLDSLIATTLAWHRQNELPRYVEHLSQLRRDLQQPLTAAEIQAHRQRLNQHWDRLYQHVIPNLIPLIQSLSDRQVAQIIDTVAEQEQQLKQEELELTLAKRIVRSNKQMKQGMEKRLGALTKQQQRDIEQYNSDRHRSVEMWFAYRGHYQQLLETGLRQRADTAELQRVLNLLLVDYDRLKSPELLAMRDANEQLLLRALTDIQHSLTAKQSAKLDKELAKFQQDFAELHRQ